MVYMTYAEKLTILLNNRKTAAFKKSLPPVIWSLNASFPPQKTHYITVGQIFSMPSHLSIKAYNAEEKYECRIENKQQVL